MVCSRECPDVVPASPVAQDYENRESAFPRASQAVLELDMDGTIRVAKEGFCGLLGYQTSEVVGRCHGDIISSYEGEASRYAEFWRLISGGETVGMEYGFQARDGREIRLTALHGPKLDEGGRLVGFLIFALNVPQSENDAKAELVGYLDTELRSTLEGLLGSLHTHLDALQERASSVLRADQFDGAFDQQRGRSAAKDI